MTRPRSIFSAVVAGVVLYIAGVLVATAIAFFLPYPIAWVGGFIQGWFDVGASEIWVPSLKPFWAAIGGAGWLAASYAAMSFTARRVTSQDVRLSVWLLVALIACSQLLRIVWPFYVWPGVKIFRVAHQDSQWTAWLLALTSLPIHRWLAAACLVLLPILGLYVIVRRRRDLGRLSLTIGA
jgi:hypothetical protein